MAQTMRATPRNILDSLCYLEAGAFRHDRRSSSASVVISKQTLRTPAARITVGVLFAEGQRPDVMSHCLEEGLGSLGMISR